MARVCILNWTADYHAGSAAVCQALEGLLEDHEIVCRVGTTEGVPLDFGGADMVVLNGEGTMHHDRPHALNFVRALEVAVERNIPAAIVNSTWQEMRWPSGLYVGFSREPRSSKWCGKAYPDLSLSSVSRPSAPGPHEGEVVVGWGGAGGRRRLFKSYRRTLESVSLKQDSFQDVVDELAGAALYITGEYHGMYAAAAAGVPCCTYPSNTWKIESTLEWYEADGGGKSFADWLWELPRLTKEVFDEALGL